MLVSGRKTCQHWKNPSYPKISENKVSGVSLPKLNTVNTASFTSILSGASSTMPPVGINLQYMGNAPNFELVYKTSAAVWIDFVDLKNDILRTMSFTSPVLSGYPIRAVLTSRYPIVYKEAIRILMESKETYQYHSGTYGINIQYSYPIGNNKYSKGSKVIKTFTY